MQQGRLQKHLVIFCSIYLCISIMPPSHVLQCYCKLLLLTVNSIFNFFHAFGAINQFPIHIKHTDLTPVIFLRSLSQINSSKKGTKKMGGWREGAAWKWWCSWICSLTDCIILLQTKHQCHQILFQNSRLVMGPAPSPPERSHNLWINKALTSQLSSSDLS